MKMKNRDIFVKSNVFCKKRFGIMLNTPDIMVDFGDENKFSSMSVGIKLVPGGKYRADYDGRNDVWIVENSDILLKMNPKTFKNLFDFIENEEKND